MPATRTPTPQLHTTPEGADWTRQLRQTQPTPNFFGAFQTGCLENPFRTSLHDAAVGPR